MRKPALLSNSVNIFSDTSSGCSQGKGEGEVEDRQQEGREGGTFSAMVRLKHTFQFGNNLEEHILFL